MNQHKMDVIKEEFGDDLATPLEGWSFVTGDTTTRSSQPLSLTTTSQSVSNQPSPPASTSNHPSTSTSLPSHVKQTWPGVASVRLMAPYRQGLVKNAETNNIRPFIAARHNKFVPIGSNLQQPNAALLFNVELQLKQTQEQLKIVTAKLVDNQNAYEILEKKYDEFQANVLKSMEELKADNAKLHDKLNQLIANAQRHETSRANANIKQEYEDGETAIDDVASDHVKMELKEELNEETIEQQEYTTQQTSDTPNNELTDIRQVTQNMNTQFESPPNQDKLVDLFEEDEHTRGARKRELNCEGVDTERAVKRQTSELMNGEDGVSRANEGAEQSEVNEQAEAIESPKQSTAEPNQMNNQDKQYITVHLKCPQLDCSDTFPEDQLNHHMWEEHSIRPHRCLVKDCGQSFEKSIPLGRHIKSVHSDMTEWHCGKCVKHFATYQHLSIYTNQFHQLGQFQCSFPSCPFTGEYLSKMYHHYALKHKPTLSCRHADCNYRTSKSSHLKDHERTHSGTKPYRCKWPNCDYASARQSPAVKHIRQNHLAPNSNSAPNGAQLTDPKHYLEVVSELL